MVGAGGVRVLWVLVFSRFVHWLYPRPSTVTQISLSQIPSLGVSYGRLLYSLLLIRATGNRSPDLRQLWSDLPVCNSFETVVSVSFPYTFRYLPFNITNPSSFVPNSHWVLVEQSFSYRRQIPCIYFMNEKRHTNFIHWSLQVLTVRLNFSQVASNCSNHFFFYWHLRHLPKPKDKIFKTCAMQLLNI